ncbi:hypothetical protein [Nocardioides sp.]|uniref:hypothetical protein n=1 Tax=Nocardioides sp. TaxID=35761 RepID=UPI002C8ABE13|nr:hypothetical protein [Nocardioides sp.]HSX69056.1 hypothetical protein [Nocardioides sp.]
MFLQGALFMSAVAGQSTIADFSFYSWPFKTLQVALFLWVAFVLVRNLVRLWRAPAAEARRAHRLPLFLVGAAFLLFASGPLIEGRHLSTKPLGVIWLLVGLNLIALGVREVLRLRRVRTTTITA